MKESLEPTIHPKVFIKEVEKRPELYKGDPLDRERKHQLWTEVGEVVFSEWPTLSRSAIHDRILLLQKRWKSFRDTYNRELRLRRSGNRPNRRVYKFYKYLKFLGGHEDLPDEPKDEDMELEDDAIYFQLDDTLDDGPVFKDEPNYDDEDDEPPQKIKKKTNSRKPKPKKKGLNEEFEHSLSEDVPLSVPIYAEDDGDRLFMLSFLSEMKKLPVNIKMWARTQISNVMEEAVMSSLNNTQPGRSGTYHNNFQDRGANAERKSSSSSD